MLESPLTLPNGETLPNRIAKPAMSESLADTRNQPTPTLERLYARWSEGGAGLVITGNVMIDRRYLERARNVVVDHETDRARLRRFADAATRGGAKAIVQINHAGRQTNRFIAPVPVAPSVVPPVRGMRAFGVPRALAEVEIEGLVERFAEAAGTLEEAGFHGVQIHAAHGYLISQFLSPRTNLRSDRWGGPLEHRARFLLEVVRAVRARVAPRFIVAVKLNSADFQKGGFTQEDSMRVIELLGGEGVDLLEVSGGNYEAPELLRASASTRDREAFFLDYAETARAHASMPLMLTGGLRSRAVMERALESGAIDVVGIARPLAFDPELPRKLLSGELTAAASVGPAPISAPSLSAAAEAAWFAAQLGRIGGGQDGDPSLGTYLALLRYLASDALLGVWRRWSRRPPRLPASAARALPA